MAAAPPSAIDAVAAFVPLQKNQGTSGTSAPVAKVSREVIAAFQGEPSSQPVADAEDGRARGAALHFARALTVRPGVGHQLSSIRRSSARVGSAASFGESSGCAIGQSIPALSQRAPISSSRS